MKARIPGQSNMSRNDMMQRIQKMQEEMQARQEEIEATDFTAGAGGGLVEVTVNGRHEVQKIHISPEAVDPDDVEMLEDFLMIAFNEAIRKASETMDAEMGKLTGGMNIPGLGL